MHQKAENLCLPIYTSFFFSDYLWLFGIISAPLALFLFYNTLSAEFPTCLAAALQILFCWKIPPPQERYVFRLTEQEKSASIGPCLRRSEQSWAVRQRPYGLINEMDEETLLQLESWQEGHQCDTVSGSSCKKDPGLWVVSTFPWPALLRVLKCTPKWHFLLPVSSCQITF